MKKNLDNKCLGKTIRSFRLDKNMTTRVLADAVGISEGYLSNLENGVGSKLNIMTIERIALALGVTIDDLLCDSLDVYNKSDYTANIMRLVANFNDKQLVAYDNILEKFLNSKQKSKDE